MADAYTHVYTAMQALMRSGQTVASKPAFMAGANGPDPLSLYRIGSPKRKPNLPQLAYKMHHEKTGDFLLALIQYATTPVQQSYALGFVTHYTTDCTLYPYFTAMSRPGMPYGEENGLWLLEAAADSELYYQDYKTRLVPLHAATPVLITGDLGEVSTLLRDAIADVYGVSISLLALADAFHKNLAVRRRMISKTGIKRALLSSYGKGNPARYGGPLRCRMQPAKPLRSLPGIWTNPYSSDEMDLTFPEVIALAEQTGAVCISAVMRYWLGELAEDKLAEILGNNDYTTGLPVAAKAAEEGQDIQHGNSAVK